VVVVADSIHLKDLRLDFPHLVRVMATLHILLLRGRLVGEKDGHRWWLAQVSIIMQMCNMDIFLFSLPCTVKIGEISYIATSLLSSNSVLLAVYIQSDELLLYTGKQRKLAIHVSIQG